MADTAAERRAHNDMGLFMLKLATFGALLGVLAATVGDTAAGIVLFAAAAGALGWGWRKIVTPLVHLAELLEDLPAWMAKVDSWNVEERMAGLEEQAHEAAVKADTAAEQADVAASRARESVNVTKAIARVVGATVRGDPDDE